MPEKDWFANNARGVLIWLVLAAVAAIPGTVLLSYMKGKGWDLDKIVQDFAKGAPSTPPPESYGSIKPPSPPKATKREDRAKCLRDKEIDVALAEERVKRAELELKQCVDAARWDIVRMWNVEGHCAVYRMSKGGLEAHAEVARQRTC